ncbi:hypothetical protein [Streptosporangium saharense]|uniref:hypothetical protein n=1 Tax=Streptosporangium saharense TaxID=1706840 RepID=UPI0034467E35
MSKVSTIVGGCVPVSVTGHRWKSSLTRLLAEVIPNLSRSPGRVGFTAERPSTRYDGRGFVLAPTGWTTRYDTVRRHSRLGRLSPIDHEKTTDGLPPEIGVHVHDASASCRGVGHTSPASPRSRETHSSREDKF